MAKSEYTDLTYFMIYGYKLVKNLDTFVPKLFTFGQIIGYKILQNTIGADKDEYMSFSHFE